MVGREIGNGDGGFVGFGWRWGLDMRILGCFWGWFWGFIFGGWGWGKEEADSRGNDRKKGKGKDGSNGTRGDASVERTGFVVGEMKGGAVAGGISG